MSGIEIKPFIETLRKVTCNEDGYYMTDGDIRKLEIAQKNIASVLEEVNKQGFIGHKTKVALQRAKRQVEQVEAVND